MLILRSKSDRFRLQTPRILLNLTVPPEGFKGGLSAGNYIRITGTSPATATRDLADMVAKGALSRAGERRYVRYHLAIPLRPVSPMTIGEDGAVRWGVTDVRES